MADCGAPVTIAMRRAYVNVLAARRTSALNAALSVIDRLGMIRPLAMTSIDNTTSSSSSVKPAPARGLLRYVGVIALTALCAVGAEGHELEVVAGQRVDIVIAPGIFRNGFGSA